MSISADSNQQGCSPCTCTIHVQKHLWMVYDLVCWSRG
jgi:hypothetical protein